MTRPSLRLLVLVTTAACGSGRVVPADSPEPSSAPAAAEPVAEPTPAPSAEPTPAPSAEPTPAPSAEPTSQAPAPAPAPAAAPAAAGYAPYDSSASIAIRRVGEWSTSGVTAPARLVIRDDTAYARFWSALGDAGSRPSVDFTRDLVIVAAAGQQTAGGHAIEIERVTRVGAGLAIQVVETMPGPGCPTAQALTQPVDVVVVEAADARTWSFSDRKVTGRC